MQGFPCGDSNKQQTHGMEIMEIRQVMQQWNLRLLTRGWPDQIIPAWRGHGTYYSAYCSELRIKLLLAAIERFLNKFTCK